MVFSHGNSVPPAQGHCFSLGTRFDPLWTVLSITTVGAPWWSLNCLEGEAKQVNDTSLKHTQAHFLISPYFQLHPSCTAQI